MVCRLEDCDILASIILRLQPGSIDLLEWHPVCPSLLKMTPRNTWPYTVKPYIKTTSKLRHFRYYDHIFTDLTFLSSSTFQLDNGTTSLLNPLFLRSSDGHILKGSLYMYSREDHYIFCLLSILLCD